MERIDIVSNLKLPHGQLAQPSEPITLGRMKVDTINAQTGDYTGFHCKKCKNKGFLAFLRGDDSFYIQDCTCMPMRRCIRQMEKSGLSKNIKELTFDTFQANTPWQTALKTAVTEYAKAPEGWLMIGGQSGSGKTHLCTAVCRELLLKGNDLLYMPWREYVAKLKALSLDSGERTELIEKCKTTAYLYIDDLFKTGRHTDNSTMPTSADINLAFEILNHRYCQRLTTIISSEKTPQELVAIDEATGSRVIEMCGKFVFSISPDTGKNYRLRNIVSL